MRCWSVLTGSSTGPVVYRMASSSSGSVSEPVNPVITPPARERSASAPTALRIARTSFADRAADQRMDCSCPKRFLHRTCGIVDGPMQRVKIFAVCREAKRARFDALHGIHRRNNLKDCELICGLRDLESATASALRPDKPGARKQPQNFSKIIGGDVRIRRNFLSS